MRPSGQLANAPSSRRPLGGFPQPSAGGNFGEFTSMDSLAAMPFDDLRRHVTRNHSSVSSSADARAHPAHAPTINPYVSRSPLPSQFANVPLPQTRAAIPQYSYEELVALDENNVRRGVSESVIRRLPRTKTGSADNNTDCLVCMEKFTAGGSAVKLPCNHKFHEDCIKPWFAGNRTCPVCRYEVQK